MAYRYGDDRNQMILFPESIDQYVSKEHPVRAYDAFIDALEFDPLDIDIDERKVGNSQYDPRLMLKLLLYGYSYSVKSSRKLERELHNNLSFIWLLKNLKPDHKTIAEFRRNNKDQQRLKATIESALAEFENLSERTKAGRTVVRHVREELQQKVAQRYEQAATRRIYDRRKARVEHPFGYIKKVLNFRQFSLRGRSGAQAETSILATCFNLTRMISLLGGVRQFVATVASA